MAKKNAVVQRTLSVGEGEDEIVIASPAWFAWLRDALVFQYRGEQATFTARKQPRRGAMYWYAYARREGLLRCVYIGRTEDVTLERLDAVAGRFTAGIEAQATTITAEIMGDHARAVRQTAALLERLLAKQGGINLAVAQRQLEDLRLLVGQNRRLTGQAACYALDLTAVVLDALQTTNENTAREREMLLQDIHRLRTALPLINAPAPSTRGEVF